MPDVTPLTDDWLWRAVSSVGAALVTAGAMIFATRKTAEAALLARVDARVESAFKHQDLTIERQDAEIENLRHLMKAEKDECDLKLANMRAEIAELMLGEAAASYSNAHVDRAQRVGKAAQARQKGKKP